MAEENPAPERLTAPPPPRAASTPLMLQYEDLKASHPDEILLFRLGDFYEIFGEDAQRAAPILEVALTQRQGVPMCGVPHHAMARYVSKLLHRNLRVAIAEQMEDPAAAKGIVKRQVVRVISPGTILEENLLSEKANNFLLALAFAPEENAAGSAVVDISTGQFSVSEMQDEPSFPNLGNEVARLAPAEILLSAADAPPDLDGFALTRVDPEELEGLDLQSFFAPGTAGEAFLALDGKPLARRAAAMILSYIRKVHPLALRHLKPPQWTVYGDAMVLDRETLENLEVAKNNFDGTGAKTLLEFLDRTLTPMGGRLLRQWVTRPLTRLPLILERQGGVSYFLGRAPLKNACRQTLKGCADLERIVTRAGSESANPRDLIALKLSLGKVRELKQRLEAAAQGQGELAPEAMPGRLQTAVRSLFDFSSLAGLIASALSDNPPIYIEEAGVIRSGFDPGLDEKRRAAQEGKAWLQELEAREKESTKIPTLKIGYTSVFGYYIEVTKPHLSKVPPSWHRKQTLINCERFATQELKELEQKILGAEEQCLRIEKRIFRELVESVKGEAGDIQAASAVIAELDCLLALAETAESKSLARPALDESEVLAIQDGWHPVVNESLPAGAFVPNDAFLNTAEQQIVILTGPNMSGKSTYLRQVALSVLMAQIGSYVPARSARIGVVDRIFTRIGSGDRLAQGQSTFMVEMRETARILNYATRKSLVILDEVGRGTSTYDGISIAWAVIEHLAQALKPKVLFATHYFELTHLAARMPGVKNFNVQAREWQDRVIFLHKIAPGPADRSYGIHVAQIAGLPAPVVERAKKILNQLEKEHRSLLQSRSEDKQQSFNF